MRRSAVGVLVGVVAMLVTAAGVSAAPAIPLNPGQETGDVDSDAHGFFTYTIEGDTLCYTLEVEDLTTQPVGAHIHIGARRENGGIVVALITPPDETSTVSECITAAAGGNLTRGELEAIEANPRAYYVNVHTTRYPGGEIRGQLKPTR
jgi:hypothetical protein